MNDASSCWQPDQPTTCPEIRVSLSSPHRSRYWGATAAARMGLTEPGMRTWIGEQWYTVISILKSARLIESIDSGKYRRSVKRHCVKPGTE